MGLYIPVLAKNVPCERIASWRTNQKGERPVAEPWERPSNTNGIGDTWDSVGPITNNSHSLKYVLKLVSLLSSCFRLMCADSSV